MAKKTDPKNKLAAAPKGAIKPAPKKKAATSKAKVAPPILKPPSKIPKPKAAGYTQEDVALRAYFISEKRRAEGRHGDEHHDWAEAERQLAAESKRPRKTRQA